MRHAVREGHGGMLVLHLREPERRVGMREMLTVTSSVIGAGLGDSWRP